MLLKSLLTSAELLHSLDSTGGYCEDQLLILIHAGVSLAGHQVLLHPSHPIGQPIGLSKNRILSTQGRRFQQMLIMRLASEGGEEAGWFFLGRLSCWN